MLPSFSLTAILSSNTNGGGNSDNNHHGYNCENRFNYIFIKLIFILIICQNEFVRSVDSNQITKRNWPTMTVNDVAQSSNSRYSAAAVIVSKLLRKSDLKNSSLSNNNNNFMSIFMTSRDVGDGVDDDDDAGLPAAIIDDDNKDTVMTINNFTDNISSENQKILHLPTTTQNKSCIEQQQHISKQHQSRHVPTTNVIAREGSLNDLLSIANNSTKPKTSEITAMLASIYVLNSSLNNIATPLDMTQTYNIKKCTSKTITTTDRMQDILKMTPETTATTTALSNISFISDVTAAAAAAENTLNVALHPSLLLHETSAMEQQKPITDMPTTASEVAIPSLSSSSTTLMAAASSTPSKYSAATLPVPSTLQQHLLSRPKRYLSFPEGSSFSVAVCFTVGIIGNPRFNYMSFGLNWGVAYDLPNTSWIINHLHGFGKHPIPVAVLHRRSKRTLYKEIENVVDNMGYNGRDCVLRALCESRQYFQKTKMGMIGEMLRVIFSLPKQRIFSRELHGNSDINIYDKAYRKARAIEDCSEQYDCSFSLLELAFGKYSTPPEGYYGPH